MSCSCHGTGRTGRPAPQSSLRHLSQVSRHLLALRSCTATTFWSACQQCPADIHHRWADCIAVDENASLRPMLHDAPRLHTARAQMGLARAEDGAAAQSREEPRTTLQAWYQQLRQSLHAGALTSAHVQGMLPAVQEHERTIHFCTRRCMASDTRHAVSCRGSAVASRC